MKGSVGLCRENILRSQEQPRHKDEFFETNIKQARNQYIKVFSWLGDTTSEPGVAQHLWHRGRWIAEFKASLVHRAFQLRAVGALGEDPG